MSAQFLHGVRPVVLDTAGQRYYGVNHRLDTSLGDYGHCFETEDGAIIGREESGATDGR